MHFRPFSLIASMVPVAVFFLLSPTLTQAREQSFDVTGVIRGKLDDGQLVIEHEEIPGFMAAMTMAFNVADPKETAALKVGDHVRFRFRVSETESVADNFSVTGHTAPPAAAKPAAARKPRLREGDAVPAFSLVDEKGRPIAEGALRDKHTVVTFIFTRCPVPEFCPAIALKFAALQQEIAKDPQLAANVRLLSITLDPEFDRPDVLAEYGKAVGARPEIWNFATGDRAQTDALAKAFAVYTERNGATLDHTLSTAWIGPDGRVREIWRGNGWKPDDVLPALRAAH